MAVSLSVTLPDQPPPFGGSRFVPLGGDGRSAPQSMYVVGMLLNGDASGGDATLTLVPDPQFTSVADYVTCGTFSSVAAVTGIAQVVAGGENAGAQFTLAATGLGAGEATQTTTWSPPTILLETNQDPSIRFVTPNVNGVTYSLTVRLYNFGRDVKHRVPLPVLFGSFNRATALSSP